MNLLIVGAGYVGLTTSVCLANRGNIVVCIDNNKEKIRKLNSGKSVIHEKGIQELLEKALKNNTIKFSNNIESISDDINAIFICVGTPEKENGDVELKYVYEAVKEILNKINKDNILVIKSTVPVGECENIEKFIKNNINRNINIEVVSNPEFLSQGRAVEDTLKEQRIIIGAENEDTIKIMNKIYEKFPQEKLITTRKNAEMIKYASNSFLALKISYINSIANLCEILGADIECVAKGIGLDKRIGNSFLKAGVGYGGSCFPKDTKALANLAIKNGVALKLIEDTIEINDNQNFILFEKAKKIIPSFHEVNVAILGLTFKPETDDLREAPALKNLQKLIKEGANISVYDPVANNKCKDIFPNIKYNSRIEDTIENAEACFIFTEWEDIKKFDEYKFIKLMKRPLIFDGRNCYDLEKMKKMNIEYYSIGRR